MNAPVVVPMNQADKKQAAIHAARDRATLALGGARSVSALLIANGKGEDFEFSH